MQKTLIIAEAGVNHNGSLERAKKMINVAKECNVDIIKFQTAIPESLVSKFAAKAEYQQRNMNINESQLDMIRKLILTFPEYIELALYCKEKGILFLSTPFDLESIAFLEEFDMPFWKIPSGEITNYPYLVKIAQTKRPVIMSTGMSEIIEIKEAIEVLRANGCEDIKLLHCNTEYPTPYEDVNLLAMNTLKEEFGVEVGYSDHTLGIEVSLAAVALGARIIEKHFTLDRTLEGPDHKASLEPKELSQMVQAIRNIEKGMGSKEKKPTKSERKNMIVARKSIIASRAIKEGEIFTEDNITTKRPGNGINPMKWKKVMGKSAVRSFKEDELIEL